MMLKRTPFFSFHSAAGARLIDFGGWEMPVQFTGILDEHRAVRRAVGLFDVSHMGEVRVRGPAALQALQGLVTNDLDTIVDGQAQYTVMCNERGGIVDDLLIYRVSSEDLLICVNAANREKDFAWMVDHNPLPDQAEFIDESDEWAQVAIQGRHAARLLQQLTSVDLSSVATYHFTTGSVAGVDGCIIARTGYTGEDGFEVFLRPDVADIIWPAIVDAGSEYDLQLIGLGARDTLRLEARYCLYGNDITDDTTPLEAGLGWVTKLGKAVPFIGQEALKEQRAQRVKRRLMCMIVEGRIARPHHAIFVDGQRVGEVTSGTRSPTLNKNIALGYVAVPHARPGNSVVIDVRGRQAPATLVRPPFYKRDY